MYVILAETGKQSYFSHLHSCVHPRWIQDHKNSWTIPLYLYKWHCPCCSCGYSEHTHQCLQWSQLNDMCHHDCRERMKKYTDILENNEKKNACWSSLTDNNCLSNGIKRVKYYLDYQMRLLPRFLGFFYYHNNKNIRSLFVLPSLMTDMAWRKFITCTIVSIPTESRFTYTLRRSTESFANSVFIAIVGGILSISADVWNEPNSVYKNSWYTMLTYLT